MKKQKSLPNNTVKVATAARELRDGVIGLAKIKPLSMPGSKVFVHYNGPTDQRGCAGLSEVFLSTANTFQKLNA